MDWFQIILIAQVASLLSLPFAALLIIAITERN